MIYIIEDLLTNNENVEIQQNYKIHDYVNIFPIYPNPFNPLANVSYVLENDAKVKVDIYNISGKHIKNLINTKQKEGHKNLKWNGINNYGQTVAAGLYIFSFQINNDVYNQKVLLLK